MITLWKKCVVLAVCVWVYSVAGDMLETERTSFFGFSREVAISRSTLELVDQLTVAVMVKSVGDRRVRRYYQRYDTPFAGPERRSEDPVKIE